MVSGLFPFQEFCMVSLVLTEFDTIKIISFTKALRFIPGAFSILRLREKEMEALL